MVQMTPPFPVHALDILRFVQLAQSRGEACALIVVTKTVGGGMRAPGALMAVTAQETVGYVSNGCVDTDVILQAREAMATGQPRTLRYGQDSPFMDVRLPCGGALELHVIPDPYDEVIQYLTNQLKNRQSTELILQDGNLRSPGGQGEMVFPLSPKLKIRAAGRGVELLVFAQLAKANDAEVIIQSPDDEILGQAEQLGFETLALRHPDAHSASHDDPWTACVLMFHDHEWELSLLKATLDGPAFYIGALGSRRTHEARCAALLERGVASEQLKRIHGPIGMIPSTRDAHMLALSTLAEVGKAFQEVIR